MDTLGRDCAAHDYADYYAVPGFERIHWPVNNPASRDAYEEVFNRMQAVLDANGVIYVHCKSGKDRSAFAVAAYLMIQEGVQPAFCRHALKERVDRWNSPMANLSSGTNADQMAWARSEWASRWA